MTPIFEQGPGHGIGHSLESFMERFTEICTEHQNTARAKSFAFIFYDFDDHDLQTLLRDIGVFAKLDRLAGRELSIFYLHAASQGTLKQFNSHFLKLLGAREKAHLPCVVFFRIHEGALEDIRVANLDGADLVHGFHELYVAIEQYIAERPAGDGVSLHWLTSSTKFVGVEVFRAALKRALDFFL